MPIDVRGPDGTVYRVNTDDENEARQTVRRHLARSAQEQEARARGVDEAGRAAPPARPEPNEAQRQEAARMALQRTMNRRMSPFGFATFAQPFANMLGDPARRQQAAQSVRGAVDMARQIPSLDLGQLARDTAQNAQQGVQDLPRMAGQVVQNLPQIARAATYGPFADEERAQQQLDLARILGDQQGVEEAAQGANEQTALAGLNLAAPGVMGSSRSVLRAGAAAAALDAPFALSRGEGDLQERLARALPEMAGVGTFAGGLQGLINGAQAIPRVLPSRGAQMVQRMDRAGASVDASGAPATPRGVQPSFATANEGRGISAPATNLIADNIFAGGPTRGRLRRSATQFRDATRDVRDAYGRPLTREAAGRRIQEGLEHHAGARGLPNPQPGTNPLNVSVRGWSHASKAEAVFDQALRPIEANPARLAETRAALGRIAARADAPEVRGFRPDTVVNDFSRRVQRLERRAQNGAPPTLRDIRELRRKIREAQSGGRNIGPQAVDYAALQQLERALSQDMYAAAGAGADALRRADQFYARGMRRIDSVRRLMDPDNPARTFEQIMRAASRRTENTRFLAAVRSLLPDDEWRVMAASLIDEMGAPNPGAAGFVAEQGFSIANFARNYRTMTPRARRILFGSRGGQGGPSARTMRSLADDLDNLAVIADAQKAVAAGANTSGSATHLQNVGSIVTLVNPQTAGVGLMGVIGGVLTGEMLTNPAFVRWLVSAQRRGGGAGGMRRNLADLTELATRDPAIWPAVTELQAALEGRQSSRAPGASGDPQGTRSQIAEPIQ